MSGFEIHCVTDSTGIPIDVLGKVAKALPKGAVMDGTCSEGHDIADSMKPARCVVRFSWKDDRR